MNIHKNARLTVKGRELLISRLERGERPQDVAAAMAASKNWRLRNRANSCASAWRASWNIPANLRLPAGSLAQIFSVAGREMAWAVHPL